MELVGIGLMVLGLVWTGAFAWAHFRAVGKAKAAESWPSVPGQVASCAVVEEESSDSDGNSSTWYNPVVSYSYTAGGRQFESTRLHFGNYRSTTRKKAEAMLTPYPAGSSPAVRYNPERPEECVLETNRPGPIYLIMALFGLLFIGFGLFWESLV